MEVQRTVGDGEDDGDGNGGGAEQVGRMESGTAMVKKSSVAMAMMAMAAVKRWLWRCWGLPVLLPSGLIVGLSFGSLLLPPLGCAALGAIAAPYLHALARILLAPPPPPPSSRCVDLSLKDGEEETILKAIDVVKRIVGYVPPPYLSVTQQMEGLCKFTGLQSPYAYEDLSLEEIKEQLILLEILVGVKAPADAEI